MTSDETFDDFADLDPNDCEYVCTNSACENYSKAVYVKVCTELGSSAPVDDRDLDCPCGARLVEQGGIEHVSPETRRRYQEVGA